MSTLREAAQQALEALETNRCNWKEKEKALSLLRAALAESPDSTKPIAEPVGWLEAPHGAFRANPNLKHEFPPQSLEWRIPLFVALAEPVQETGVKLNPVFYAPRILDDEEVEDIIKRNAAITESILDIDRKEPQPGMVNLDAFRAFHFNDPPKGGFVGEIEMLKWLVRNRDGDYWKAKYQNT